MKNVTASITRNITNEILFLFLLAFDTFQLIYILLNIVVQFFHILSTDTAIGRQRNILIFIIIF